MSHGQEDAQAGPSKSRTSSFNNVGRLKSINTTDQQSSRTLNGRPLRDDASNSKRKESEDDDEDDLPAYTEPRPNDRTPQTDTQRERFLKRNDEVEDSDDEREQDGMMLGPEDDGVMAGLGDLPLKDTSMNMRSINQRKAEWWRNTLITALFVLSWYGFATILSLYNKWMFSPQYYNFPFPLFVTGCHMIVQFTLATFVLTVWSARYKPEQKPSWRDYGLKVFPTSAATAGDIGLSNLSLRLITLSLYTMCKSSTLIFVLLFAFAFRLEYYSLHLVSVIGLIAIGVFLMVYDTTSVDIPGVIMVFSASALSGLRWALTETLMKKKEMGLTNPFATIYWLAPLMAITLLPISMGVEGWGNVFGNGHFDGLSSIFTVGVILFPGACAFAMVASEYFIIHRAGILPLSVAGVFKEVTTISFSAWIFGDQLTELNIIGVAIAVCGIALYSYFKYQKAVSNPDPHSPPHHRSESFEPQSPGAASNAYTLAHTYDPDAQSLPASPVLPGRRNQSVSSLSRSGLADEEDHEQYEMLKMSQIGDEQIPRLYGAGRDIMP